MKPNPNAAIDELRAMVGQLSGRVEDLNARVLVLGRMVDSLANEVKMRSLPYGELKRAKTKPKQT